MSTYFISPAAPDTFLLSFASLLPNTTLISPTPLSNTHSRPTPPLSPQHHHDLSNTTPLSTNITPLSPNTTPLSPTPPHFPRTPPHFPPTPSHFLQHSPTLPSIPVKEAEDHREKSAETMLARHRTPFCKCPESSHHLFIPRTQHPAASLVYIEDSDHQTSCHAPLYPTPTTLPYSLPPCLPLCPFCISHTVVITRRGDGVKSSWDVRHG
ncbi:lysine-rich arabinogalactan protein 19-like [Penaeus chinensis]|uniref:lysine-rich arabinogalactan protein 19-like n=1 Tax=Penaeus chinensis TaxID=139456 RepID=UPI001FB7846B|nr:lysine-rich arabinogalactan protein 19-like [Penaeus chinensis]